MTWLGLAGYGVPWHEWHGTAYKAIYKRILVMQCFSTLHTLNNIVTAPPM